VTTASVSTRASRSCGGSSNGSSAAQSFLRNAISSNKASARDSHPDPRGVFLSTLNGLGSEASAPTPRRPPSQGQHTPVRTPPGSRAAASDSVLLADRLAQTVLQETSKVTPQAPQASLQVRQPSAQVPQQPTTVFHGCAGAESWRVRNAAKAKVHCPSARCEVDCILHGVDIDRSGPGHGHEGDAVVNDGHAGKHAYNCRIANMNYGVKTFQVGPLQSMRVKAALQGDGDWGPHTPRPDVAGRPSPWEVPRRKANPKHAGSDAAGWPTKRVRPELGEKLEEDAKGGPQRATSADRLEAPHAPFWEERTGSALRRSRSADAVASATRRKVRTADDHLVMTPRGKKHFYNGEAVSAPSGSRLGAVVFGAPAGARPEPTSNFSVGMSSRALNSRVLWQSMRAQDDLASDAGASTHGIPRRTEHRSSHQQESSRPREGSRHRESSRRQESSRHRAPSSHGSSHRTRSAR